MKYDIIQFDKNGDDRGMLIALEEEKNIPFSIKRVYYMFNTVVGVRRGFHAHKKLKQVLVCVKGECKILLDDSTKREVVELNNPYKGLHIEANIWREMFDFSDDAVLMVLASDYYDESDYIRSYQDYLNYMGGI